MKKCTEIQLIDRPSVRFEQSGHFNPLIICPQFATRSSPSRSLAPGYWKGWSCASRLRRPRCCRLPWNRLLQWFAFARYGCRPRPRAHFRATISKSIAWPAAVATADLLSRLSSPRSCTDRYCPWYSYQTWYWPSWGCSALWLRWKRGSCCPRRCRRAGPLLIKGKICRWPSNICCTFSGRLAFC